MANSIKSVIENYINGNLKDAKEGAKKYKLGQLTSNLRHNFGYKCATALKVANYLKGFGSFQEAADAEFADKQAK